MGQLSMNFSEIKKLIRLFEGSEVTELEVEQEGIRVLMKKNSPSIPLQNQIPISTEIVHTQSPEVVLRPAHQKPDRSGLSNILESPMVGTFYRASSPTTPSYVEVGDMVKPGQILCIVEAMKLMNEIESEVTGKVSKIFPESGKPVEFGEPLFEIDPI